MCFLTEMLLSPHTPTLFHFYSLPPWKSFSLSYKKARHLVSWHPLSGTLLCWQFSMHTLLLLTLNFCFCCSLCSGCSFLSHLHPSPLTHWLDAICKTESTWGCEEGFREEMPLPHLSPPVPRMCEPHLDFTSYTVCLYVSSHWTPLWAAPGWRPWLTKFSSHYVWTS